MNPREASRKRGCVSGRGNNVRVYDNAILMGGRYNEIMWDVQDSAVNPTSSFDHNFLAGKSDRGVTLVLDGALYPQIKSNYFGQRPEGGPSGHTNGWETIIMEGDHNVQWSRPKELVHLLERIPGH